MWRISSCLKKGRKPTPFEAAGQYKLKFSEPEYLFRESRMSVNKLLRWKLEAG